MRKDLFIEQSHMIEDCTHFLRKIEELKLYMMGFDKDNTIKHKIYSFDYTVGNKN